MTCDVPVTSAESKAVGHLVLVAALMGLLDMIEQESGAEWRVHLDSFVEKMASRFEQPTDQHDREQHAAFVAELDQRKAALKESAA